MPTLKEEFKKFIDALEALIGAASTAPDPDNESAILDNGVQGLKQMAGYRVFQEKTDCTLSVQNTLATFEGHLKEAKEAYEKMQ